MVLAIVVSVILSGLVSAMAWVAGESAQRTAGLSKMDQAFFAAEAGAQRVQWYSTNGKMGTNTWPVANFSGRCPECGAQAMRRGARNYPDRGEM